MRKLKLLLGITLYFSIKQLKSLAYFKPWDRYNEYAYQMSMARTFTIKRIWSFLWLKLEQPGGGWKVKNVFARFRLLQKTFILRKKVAPLLYSILKHQNLRARKLLSFFALLIFPRGGAFPLPPHKPPLRAFLKVKFTFNYLISMYVCYVLCIMYIKFSCSR